MTKFKNGIQLRRKQLDDKRRFYVVKSNTTEKNFNSLVVARRMAKKCVKLGIFTSLTTNSGTKLCL